MLAAGMILSGCSGAAAADAGAAEEMTGSTAAAEEASTQAAEEAAPVDPIQEVLDSMTLEDKVGQLFIIAPEQLGAEEVEAAQTVDDTEVQMDNPALTTMTDVMRENLERYPVGGIILFAQNIVDQDQLNTFLTEFQDLANEPLLVAVDEEGGRVARLANHEGFDLPRYESAAAVAASGNLDDVRDMSITIGTYIKEYGFNLDFAPVADVNSNPDNPVIGSRAFSSDPAVTAEMVTAAVEGYHEAGVLTTLKHFPGHGDTGEDSHLGTATSYKTYEEMQECEMLPFEAGIAAGADMIMTAHVTTPNATDDGLPASLSYTWLIERLRGDLGYDGVIVADALRMEAIAQTYGSVESAIMALEAGVDILLLPEDYIAAYKGVLAAVQDGTITEERLDESVYRILTLKTNAGLTLVPLHD